MESNSLALVADDSRNPTYYELRAGYPAPTAQWYTGGPVGIRKRPQFTKENLVRGMNLTCGSYYRLRQELVMVVLSTGICQADLSSLDGKWDLAEVVEKTSALLFENGKFDHIPAFWREVMSKEFTIKIIRWIKKHQIRLNATNTKLHNLPRKANWKWNKDGRQAPNFDGYFQLQHLQIKVQVPGGSFRLPVRRLIDDPNFRFTPLDVDYDKISFAKLQHILQQVEANS